MKVERAKDIGPRIKQLRKACGFSQGDVEHQTKLLCCYTSRVENGHTIPKLETLAVFAHCFGLKLWQLFDGSPAQLPKAK